MRWLALLLVGGCGRIAFDERVDASVIEPDLCASVPALAAAPAIDGVLDASARTQTLAPLGWQSREIPEPPIPNIPVAFAIAWRPDGLYWFVDVSDSDRFPSLSSMFAYCGDGVELYVDDDGVFASTPNFDLGTGQYIVRAPVTDVDSRHEGDSFIADMQLSTWTGNYIAVPRAGGYVVEAFIDATALAIARWSLAPGVRVGLDLGLNVSRPDGAFVPLPECPQNLRLGQFFQHVDDSMAAQFGRGAPYETPTAYCTPILE